MPVVTISARHIFFPSVCLCCGEAADREVDAVGHNSAGRSKTWTFPACAACVTHEQEAHQRHLERDGKPPEAPRKPTCECPGRLVQFVRWSATDNTFSFGSQRYALAFAELNPSWP